MLREQYPTVFSEPTFPPSREWDHKIPTGNAAPIRQKDRPRSPKEHGAIAAFIEDGLAKGIIEPANGSPWASPLHLVKKKDGSYRPCVDYRKLNDVTVKDAYPLTRIDDGLQFLRGAKYFTTIDLKSGYWQLQVAEADRDKTAFISRYGIHRFKVMPFGLATAPASFQAMINGVLGDLVDKCIIP